MDVVSTSCASSRDGVGVCVYQMSNAKCRGRWVISLEGRAAGPIIHVFPLDLCHLVTHPLRKTSYVFETNPCVSPDKYSQMDLARECLKFGKLKAEKYFTEIDFENDVCHSLSSICFPSDCLHDMAVVPSYSY